MPGPRGNVAPQASSGQDVPKKPKLDKTLNGCKGYIDFIAIRIVIIVVAIVIGVVMSGRESSPSVQNAMCAPSASSRHACFFCLRGKASLGQQMDIGSRWSSRVCVQCRRVIPDDIPP